MLLASHSSEASRPLKLRAAAVSDLSAISLTWNAAFFDDALIGDLMHPSRAAYPQDVLRWFQHGVRSRFWEWEHRFIVVVWENPTTAKEEIVGVADWRRLGTPASLDARLKKGLALPQWDPRRMIAPLIRAVNGVEEWWQPNRAAKGSKASGFIDNALEEAEKFYHGKRAECWDLYVCGVHPSWQGKGVGKLLVEWGINKAREERCSASVMTGKKCESFYRKAGFEHVLSNEESGIVCFWDAEN